MAKLHRAKRGFSLIEMVVALAVMAMVLTMTLVSFPKLRDQISLTMAVRELALNIRKAQSYAIAVREFDTSFTANLCKLGYDEATDGSVRFPPYGIAIAKQDDGLGNDKFNYSLFGDINCNTFLGEQPVYQPGNELIELVAIKNGAEINKIDGYTGGGNKNNLRSAQIVYQRPSPSVTIIGTENNGATAVYTGRIEITLKASGSGLTQIIIVRPTGQISIK